MKKRMVEVAAGQELSETEYEDLYTHARNSGIWYAMNLPKTTHEFRKKLYEKGYPKEPVFVLKDGGREERDLVELVVKSLVDSYYIEDRFIAQRHAERRRGQRYGRSRIAMELRHRGIDETMAEEVLDEVFEDDGDELEELVRRTWKMESARSDEVWKVRQKVIRKVAQRGWDFGAIMEKLDLLSEEEEWDQE